MRRTVPLRHAAALALAGLAACGDPAGADGTAARSDGLHRASATVPPVAPPLDEGDRFALPEGLDARQAPAAFYGREVTFSCAPGDDATPRWVHRGPGHATPGPIAGGELFGIERAARTTLFSLSLADGGRRLAVEVPPYAGLLGAAGDVVLLAHASPAGPVVEGRARSDGAVRWSRVLGAGTRVVATSGERLLLIQRSDDAAIRATAVGVADGIDRWCRDLGAGAGAGVPGAVVEGELLVVAWPVEAAFPRTEAVAVDLASGGIAWRKGWEGRLERLRNDGAGHLHLGIRTAGDRACEAGGYVVSLDANGVERWAARQAALDVEGDRFPLNGPALAARDRLLLLDADILDAHTGGKVGEAPIPAAAATTFRVAGRTAFATVAYAGGAVEELHAVDLPTGRPLFVASQWASELRWELAALAPTGAGSVLLQVDRFGPGVPPETALCELGADGTARRAVRLPAPPEGHRSFGGLAAGDAWVEVTASDPWATPAYELRAFDLAGFSPLAPPPPAGRCNGESGVDDGACL